MLLVKLDNVQKVQIQLNALHVQRLIIKWEIQL